MPVGITFGSATSGTGFDVTSTVNSILALARTPEAAWSTRTTALQAQETVLTTLGANVSSLSTALSSLTSFDGAFSQMQGASSNSSFVALTSVGQTAQSGTHTFTVQHLATTAQQYSSAVSATATVSGSLTIQQQGASAATPIQIASGTSLADAVAQINSSNTGVNATILSDSSGRHISLTSTQSGKAGDLTVTSTLQDSGGHSVAFTASQPGDDAQYTLDGVALTSSSNTVTSALQGVAFTLIDTTGTGSASSVRVQIAPDESGIVSALQSFISAYNTLGSALTTQEGKDSSGNAQPLYGSTVISEIQSRLSASLAFAPSGSDNGLSLGALGLSLSLDGTLSLDTGVLATALADHYSDVSASFLSSGSFGQSFSAALTSVGKSSTGTVGLALSSNSTEEATLADNKTSLESRLSTYQTTLTAELNTANQILQAIPQRLDEVNQMFYSINGYKSS